MRSPSPQPAPSRPPRLQHSPSLPNIWLPPHSGPIPFKIAAMDRDSFHRLPDLSILQPPPEQRSESQTSRSRATRNFVATNMFNGVAATYEKPQVTQSSDPQVKSAKPSRKAKKAQRRATNDESHKLLTPPLTPSSSIRTVASIDSSLRELSVADDNDSAKTIYFDDSSKLPENFSRLLLIKNVSTTSSATDFQAALHKTLADSLSPPTTPISLASSDSDTPWPALIRGTYASLTALPIDDYVADGAKLFCDFVSIDEFREKMGSSDFLESMQATFYVVATKADRDSEARIPSDNAALVRNVFSRRGDLLLFQSASADSINVEVQADAGIYQLQYYDIRDTPGESDGLNNFNYLGLKLQIVSSVTMPTSASITPQAFTPVPAGQASHLRERFIFPASATEDVASDSQISTTTAPNAARSASPVVFYNTAGEPIAPVPAAHSAVASPRGAPAVPIHGPDPVPEPGNPPLGPLQQFFFPAGHHPAPDPSYTFPPQPHPGHIHPVMAPGHASPPFPGYQASPPPHHGHFPGSPNLYHHHQVPGLFEYDQMLQQQPQMMNMHMYPMYGPNYQPYPPAPPPHLQSLPYPPPNGMFQGPPTPPTEYWHHAPQNGPVFYQQAPLPGLPTIDIDQGIPFVESTHLPPHLPPHSPSITLPSSSTERSSSPPSRQHERSGSSGGSPREVQKCNQLDLKKIEDGVDTRTTVMIKNIPNKMSDKDLQQYIGNVCPRKIDFMYLRMDFQNGCNFGYAFVNFISVQDLLYFAKAKLNHKWNMFSSEKVLQMSYANYQGKEALVEKFKNSCIMDEKEEWRPKIFYSEPGPEQGLPEPFPAPTHHRRKERSSHNRGALYGGSTSVGGAADLGPMLRQGRRQASPSDGPVRRRGGSGAHRGRGHQANMSLPDALTAARGAGQA
uniref:RRM domain-containing protein n=1 Tax=Moniliophthora roreri TaxID=221103 RepID=A0A0W0FH36_MONRR